jgi:MFS family permease
VLPAFLRSLGIDAAQLGIIEGLAESVVSVTKLYSGYLADKLPRRKPLVVGGYAVAGAVKPLLAFVGSWWQVLGIRFSDRLAKGMRGAPRDVMLAESVPPERLGSAFGQLQAMDTAGAILGPLLALWIVAHYGLRNVFLAAAIPGILAVATAVFGIRETRAVPAPSKEAAAPAVPIEPVPRVRFPFRFYYVLAAVTIFSLGCSSDMFLVLRAQEAGIAAASAPLLGLTFNLTYTLFSWPAGKLSDKLSRRHLVAAGYLVYAAVYAVFAMAPSPAAIWGALAFYGLFYALSTPVMKALIVESVPAFERGRALGLFYFVSSVSILLASVVTGRLWKSYGAELPLGIAAGLALFAAVMLLLGPATPRAIPVVVAGDGKEDELDK